MVFGVIEIVLWDIWGKVWNMLLYQVFGGVVCKDILFMDYFLLWVQGLLLLDGCSVCGECIFEEVLDYCIYLNQIFGIIYFEGKFLIEDLCVLLWMLELICGYFGDDVMLCIDFNQVYLLVIVCRLVCLLEELGVCNWEDFVIIFEEMVELWWYCLILFLMYNVDIVCVMLLWVLDVICGNLMVVGGIGWLICFVGVCEYVGIDFWCYSGDFGIGSVVYLYLCVVFGWI